jgi:peptidoglycan/LPS O-acetylase OafA/YrhL
MYLMENKTSLTPVIWTKRIVATIAITVWIYVVYTIMQSPAPFMEQAPYCMAGTMLIFGVLTGIFKGLERWEAHITAKEKERE